MTAKCECGGQRLTLTHGSARASRAAREVKIGNYSTTNVLHRKVQYKYIHVA
jgi:hypothetical protein